MHAITPLIRERIKLLRDVLTAADFFFVDQLPPYDPAELIPQKGDAAMALKVLTRAREVLAQTEFKHDPLDQALRAAAQEWASKQDKCSSRFESPSAAARTPRRCLRRCRFSGGKLLWRESIRRSRSCRVERRPSEKPGTAPPSAARPRLPSSFPWLRRPHPADFRCRHRPRFAAASTAKRWHRRRA